MARLVDDVLALAPDRLAVYSFARVPWIKPAQRRFRDDQVPAGAEKRALYEARARSRSSTPATSRSAWITSRCRTTRWRTRPQRGALHRNFMGYTDVHTTALLGLGVSAHLRDAGLLPPEREGDHRVRAARSRRRDSHAARPSALDRKIGGGARKIAELMTTFGVRLDPRRRPTAPGALEALLDRRPRAPRRRNTHDSAPRAARSCATRRLSSTSISDANRRPGRRIPRPHERRPRRWRGTERARCRLAAGRGRLRLSRSSKPRSGQAASSKQS